MMHFDDAIHSSDFYRFTDSDVEPEPDDEDDLDDDGDDDDEPDDDDDDPPEKLTRQEQLQALADRGCDTWEDYRGER